MLEAAFPAAVAFFLLAQSITNKTDWSQKHCSNSRLADAEPFIPFVDFFPVMRFSAHGTFVRSLPYFNPPLLYSVFDIYNRIY